MLRGMEDISWITDFGYLAQIHDDNRVANTLSNSEVVGNIEVG